MDGEFFPNADSVKSGTNIVRTVYDMALASWRRHDINLDFLLDWKEFSGATQLEPEIVCVFVKGCYECVYMLTVLLCH